MKMRYSTESGIYVKGCRFLSFAKNMGTHLSSVVKNVSIVPKNLQQMQ